MHPHQKPEFRASHAPVILRADVLALCIATTSLAVSLLTLIYVLGY